MYNVIITCIINNRCVTGVGIVKSGIKTKQNKKNQQTQDKTNQEK